MEKSRILRDFHPVINKEMVFRQIQCYHDSPVYEKVEEAYEELLEEIRGLCVPRGVMALGELPGFYLDKAQGQARDDESPAPAALLEGAEPLQQDSVSASEDGQTRKTFPSGVKNQEPAQQAVYVLVTIGADISERSTRAFAEGDYVAGMLVDAMADAALFSLESDIQRELKSFCAGWKLGVKRRLEAPHDISMEVQKEVLRQTRGDELLGMSLSEGYMFYPVKTSCQIYLTSSDQELFRAEHNCRTCPNLTCSLRHVEPLRIWVQNGQEEKELLSEGGESLLEVLRREYEGIVSPCGGKGTCGKCRIQVLSGKLPVTHADEKAFSDQELALGWRLACQAVPEEDLTIRLGWVAEEQIEAVAGFEGSADRADGYKDSKPQPETEAGEGAETASCSCAFAIDIGTTTLAVQLVDPESGSVIGTWTGLNGQRTYGGDVIARIEAAIQGKGGILRERILRDLLTGMQELLQKQEKSWEQVTKIVIAGNTTMIHLLMGYPCDGLGQMPFTPYQIEGITTDAKALFSEMLSGSRTEQKLFSKNVPTVWIYPGVSAFVGADIVAGLCALEMDREEKVTLLVDLGTNGEMALGNRDGLLVASTAAGPAFEGGNITWGTGSIPGAICHARMEDGCLVTETIQQQPASGICGTGVIELVSLLVEEELVDETGLLDEQWFDDGYPLGTGVTGEQLVLTQKDIREIQLAKAAVRAGIETLLARYGITADAVGQVCVAGGFGYQLDYRKAIQIGMFPPEFAGKIRAVGNASLGGAAKLIREPDVWNRSAALAKMCREIDLSVDPVFQEAYMDGMFFE